MRACFLKLLNHAPCVGLFTCHFANVTGAIILIVSDADSEAVTLSMVGDQRYVGKICNAMASHSGQVPSTPALAQLPERRAPVTPSESASDSSVSLRSSPLNSSAVLAPSASHSGQVPSTPALARNARAVPALSKESKYAPHGTPRDPPPCKQPRASDGAGPERRAPALTTCTGSSIRSAPPTYSVKRAPARAVPALGRSLATCA